MLADEDLEQHMIRGPRRYARALDTHLDLLERLTEEGEQGDLVRRWFGYWYENLSRDRKQIITEKDRILGEHYVMGDPDGDSNARGFLWALMQGLNEAGTYYIEPNMMGFITDVAEEMPDDVTLDGIEDAPSPSGWMYLGSPVAVLDRNGTEFYTRALYWASGNKGVTLMEMSYSDEDENVQQDLRKAHRQGIKLYMPEMIPLHADIIEWGKPLQDPESFAAANADLANDEDDSNIYFSLMAQLWLRRFLAASWAVMHGRLGRPRRAPGTKVQKKRAKRRDFDWGDIRVVELRRYDNDQSIDDERPKVGRHIEWTHRWRVRGFWRWQWYPSALGPCPHCGRTDGVHRRKYIEPYVKGPENLPYIAKDTIYAVKR